jgi:hypothetical protein
MGATTSLASRQLSVTPGQSIEAKVLVRNNGTLVDQFTLDIVGDSREWTEVEPRVMNLMPGTEGEATVTFAPPRASSVPAGQVPFGVRVLSREDPPNSSVAEGVVDVEPFMDLQLELSPKTSKCRTKAVHEVVVDNAGNYPIPVEVITNDPEEQLKLSLDHSSLVVQPGTSAFLKLRAKPHDRFLRGQDKRLPFGVTATAPDQPPVSADGTVVQQQLLPKWLLPVAVAALAAAVALTVLWFTLVKPTVQTSAREAAKEQAKAENAAMMAQVDQAQDKADKAEDKADKAEKKVDDMAATGAGAGAGNGPRGATEGPNGVDISSGQAVDFRITADAEPQTDPDEFESFKTPDKAIPADKTLVVTDIILQNPRGDAGTLLIKRGDDVLYETGLANFRDLDFHFLEPLVFSPDKPLTIDVSCQLPGGTAPATGTCRPSVSFSGRLSGPAAG